MKKHNPLLYPAIEARRTGLKTYFNAMAAGLNMQKTMVDAAAAYGFAPKPYAKLATDVIDASLEMSERFARDYKKPEFNLGVDEEIVEDKAFGRLLHFKRDTTRNDPKVLLVAPMSGHYATLLRDTVKELLPDHDVYITDWKDARDVPLSKGDFGLDDYISYLKDFIKTVGPETHVIAVCQPTVATMAAVSRLAQEKSDCQPLSMTLMAGPLDVRRAETEVTKLASSKTIEWFEENMIGQVPATYPGAGRFVYPGFVQLFSFMSMNPEKHSDAHIEMFKALVDGDDKTAKKRKDFYDEYLAVCDLPEKFYIETVLKVFIDPHLAQGKLTHNGKPVDPSAITKTALLTIEGGKDDISAPGQTTVAHDLCTGLKADQKFHYLQPDAGHYGVFAGSGWRADIKPTVAGFIRETGAKNGILYDPAITSKIPENYRPPQPRKKAANDPKFKKAA